MEVREFFNISTNRPDGSFVGFRRILCSQRMDIGALESRVFLCVKNPIAKKAAPILARLFSLSKAIHPLDMHKVTICMLVCEEFNVST